MAGIRYATRERVKTASEITTAANLDAAVDDAVEAASRAVEALTLRRFYPTTATRFFDWPNEQRARPWRLWLDDAELISVTSLSSGGVTIPPSDYFLEPANLGPPYTWIELDRSSNAAFGGGATPQHDIAVTGVFGYTADTVPAGTLTAGVNASVTTLPVSNGAAVGVGDLLAVDSERMTVVDRSWTATGATVAGGGVTNQKNAVSLTLSVADAVHAGELLLVDAERMLVVDVAGTAVAVQRAVDGTVLAAHSNGAAVSVSRALTVTRGVTGTVAASHSSAAAVLRHTPPGLVVSLTVAEALDQLAQQRSSYAGKAAPASAGGGKDAVYGVGLDGLRCKVREAYGRQLRMAAV